MYSSTEEKHSQDHANLDNEIAQHESVEFEFDTQELRELESERKKPKTLRALNDASSQQDLIDPAAHLELNQSLDDLRNLSWPLCKPRK